MVERQTLKFILEAAVSALKECSFYVEEYMGKRFVKLNDDSIKKITLLHEDIAAALSLLPNFGWEDGKTSSDVQRASAIINDLHQMLQHYVSVGNSYQQKFERLSTLLEEAGVSDCVNDLVAVRRNARRSTLEHKNYIAKLKRVV